MLLISACTLAHAQSALEIMQRADQQVRSSSQQYTGNLEVHDRKGKVLRKSWRSWRTGFGGDSKSLVRFTAPPEVKGVGLLIVAHRGAPTDQWLYTPAIARDRRIAPQDRSVRFLGTDFSYEDMQERDINDYEYELIGEEKLGEQSCYKIRAVPKKELRSQYSYFYLWLDRTNFTVLLTEFYKGNDRVKILAAGSLERIQGVWTARELEMKDLKRGSHTAITLSDVQYNKPVPDEMFTLRSLRDSAQ